jgi:hypothetical protein
VVVRVQRAIRLLACFCAIFALTVAVPDEADAHGITRQLDVNERRAFAVGNCVLTIQHGNIYAAAFSKFILQNSSCQGGWTQVTGCTGPFQCRDGPFVTGAQKNVWHSSILYYHNVLWSHYNIFTTAGGQSGVLHYNVF